MLGSGEEWYHVGTCRRHEMFCLRYINIDRWGCQVICKDDWLCVHIKYIQHCVTWQYAGKQQSSRTSDPTREKHCCVRTRTHWLARCGLCGQYLLYCTQPLVTQVSLHSWTQLSHSALLAQQSHTPAALLSNSVIRSIGHTWSLHYESRLLSSHQPESSPTFMQDFPALTLELLTCYTFCLWQRVSPLSLMASCGCLAFPCLDVTV